jgi:pimeloyl-ACP methyl ester carboxylesterase
LNTKPLGVQRFDAETRRLYEMNKDKLAALGRPWDYPGSFNVRRLTDLKAWQSQRDQFPGGVSDLFDVSKPIEACDAPLLVFTAGRGKIRSDDQEAVALRTRLADQGARLVVLHHSGHWIHREQPEIFDQELLKFLQGFDVP